MPLLSRFRSQKSKNNISGKKSKSIAASSTATTTNTTNNSVRSDNSDLNYANRRSCCNDKECSSNFNNDNIKNNNYSSNSNSNSKTKNSSNLKPGSSFRVYLNPSVKNKITNAFAIDKRTRPVLSRSNTFTLNGDNDDDHYDIDLRPGIYGVNYSNPQHSPHYGKYKYI